MCKEDALPDLPLGIRNSQGEITAEPQVAAENCATERKREWDREHTVGFATELQSIRESRHVTDAGDWDLRAEAIRKASVSFPSKTAIGLDQHSLKETALLPDDALDSLASTVKQCFVDLAVPAVTLAVACSVGQRKNGGSRTVAILRATYRLSMRVISAHSSQWDVNFTGKWDSALKGDSALMLHVLRASTWPTRGDQRSL